jgi:hypothetical protein
MSTQIAPAKTNNADNVKYDPSESGLPVDNVQDAIDELNNKSTNLENRYEVKELFKDISGTTSGTIAPPTNITIIQDNWAGEDNALAVEISAGRPTQKTLFTASGTPIRTQIDSLGNYSLDGTPTASNYCILWVAGGLVIDFANAGYGYNDIVMNFDLETPLVRNSSTGAIQQINPTDFFDLLGSYIKNLGYTDFDTTFSGLANIEGRMSWNSEAGTTQTGMPGGEVVLQHGQEMFLADRPRNLQGVQINNGEVVFVSGATGAVPEVKLADATKVSSQKTIAVATENVPNAQRGYYTTVGSVRNLNTLAFAEGDQLYLDLTLGKITNSPCSFPNYCVKLGICTRSHATEGIISVKIEAERGDDVANFFNGTFREPFDARTSSNGTIITMTLERSGTGDLTMQFSDGLTDLDTTPALTIELTPGTDNIPQTNYIYIPKTTKVLTKSLTNFPSEEHIKIGFFFCSSALKVQQDDGVLINQNHNNYLASNTSLIGGYQRLMEKLRVSGAIYFSGLGGGNGSGGYITSAGATATLQVQSGTVYQAGKHQIPAIDTSAGGDVHVINATAVDGGAYAEYTNIYNLTQDASGGTLSNKYFTIVLISVANKTGEYTPLLMNLPTGTYNTLAGAIDDALGYTVTSIPREFAIDSSTAVLVCALIVRKTGATLEYYNTIDLRGALPGAKVSGGSVGGSLTNFSDSLFYIYNNLDDSKRIDFDASGITTGNTRTITMPDKDITLANDSEVVHKVGNETIADEKTFSGKIKLSTIADFSASGLDTILKSLSLGNIIFQLGDTAGNTAKVIKDKDGTVISIVDSNGNHYLGRSLKAGVVVTKNASSIVQEKVNSVGYNYHKGIYKQIGTGSAGSIDYSLLDDGYVDLEDSVKGWGFVQVGDNEEFSEFTFASDGTVTFGDSSTNIDNADTDGKFCIFDNGSNVRIKNRLGATKNIAVNINFYS